MTQGKLFAMSDALKSRPCLPEHTGKEDWRTPRWLFEAAHREFNFTVDAAASHDNALLPRYWTERENGLAQSWRGERVWYNPPYNAASLTAWTRKAWESWHSWSAPSVGLLPVKSDQAWWGRYAINAEVWFIKGRVNFLGGSSCLACPVCLMILGRGRGRMGCFTPADWAQADLLSDPPPPPYSDEETSRQAAQSLAPSVLSGMHCQILDALSREPSTCEELEMILGLKHQTVGPRIWELRRWGKIRDSGLTRKGRSGRKAIIWEVTR